MPFSIFKKKPQSFVMDTPHQVTSRTVKEVIGPDLIGAIGINKKVFTVKALKYAVKAFVVENIMFLLVVEKFKLDPTRARFGTIMDDFVLTTAARQVNISDSQRLALEAIRRALPAEPGLMSADTLNVALFEVAKMCKNDVLRRMGDASMNSAFVLETPKQRTEFNAAVAYLRDSHGIDLNVAVA